MYAFDKSTHLIKVMYTGSVPFEHGSIGRHQPQRPIPIGFPLFKRWKCPSDSCPNWGHPSIL